MDTQRLSLRDRLIGAELLRPADPDEKATAQQKCFLYLEGLTCVGVRACSRVDTQLMLAILERWYAL
jgi:hypothetical protein